jgi:hypothetical protein
MCGMSVGKGVCGFAMAQTASAEHWENLAEDRIALLTRRPDIVSAGEHDDS